MKKILRKVGVLGAVFVVSLLVFSRFTNQESKDLTVDMQPASLPIVYMIQDGMQVNELHGYVDDMDAATMADSITPVLEDNKLRLEITDGGTDTTRISYEVRSMDGSRLVESGDSIDLIESGDHLGAEITLQDLLQEGTEYLLLIDLEKGKESIHYYTEIMKEGRCNTMKCVEFARDFHDTTMNGGDGASLSIYLEPDPQADNTTLQSVSLKNKLSQVTWGELNVQETTGPIVLVKEMTEDYNVIVIRDMVSSEDENGNISYYNVEEYYRVRQGIGRMYLLDYNRTTEEIFRGGENSISGNAIHLGIRSGDVDFRSNETGTGVCFVQQGELWAYHQETNQMEKVYSFRSSDGMDARENYNQHDIRIIKTDEGGGIDFIVYGYMNRGIHEGKTGISVCRYDSVTNTVEEYLFLSVPVSYQTMKEQISQLMYTSDSGIFYLMLRDEIHAIDLETKTDQIFIEGLSEGNYQVSDNGRYVAWTEQGQGEKSRVLHVTDLNTAQTRDIEAESGYYIMPMGFMGTDCIYGLADESRIDEGGTFAAEKIQIVQLDDTGVEVLTTYEKNGYLVQSIRVKDGTIYLNLTDGNQNTVDTITNKEIEESKAVRTETVNSGVRQTQVNLVFAEKMKSSAPVLKTPKLILPEESTELKLERDIFRDNTEQ